MANDAGANRTTLDAITLCVKSADLAVRAHRQTVCRAVRDYFQQNFRVPDGHRVLCYFADSQSLQGRFAGPENRGIHVPITKGVAGWPHDIRNLAAPIDPDTSQVSWPFTSIIYLHGSTCKNDLGLTITFAHELQHFLQYCNARNLWNVEVLLRGLVPNEDLAANWNTPAETEARIVAKKVAVVLYGHDRIEEYVAEKIGSPITLDDEMSWRDFQLIDPSIIYNLAAETKRLVQRYKPQLKRMQERPELSSVPTTSLDLDLDDDYWVLDQS